MFSCRQRVREADWLFCGPFITFSSFELEAKNEKRDK